jgi:predicted PurR-regulated permease PerM
MTINLLIELVAAAPFLLIVALMALGFLWAVVGAVLLLAMDRWLPAKLSRWSNDAPLAVSMLLFLLLVLVWPLLVLVWPALWWASPNRPELYVR